MAMTQAATAKVANGKVRKERGQGPVALTYTSKDKIDLKRVSNEVTGVHVVAKNNGGTKTYNATELPDGAKNALLAKAILGTFKLYTVNHAKPDGSDSIAVIDKLWAEMLAGKMYVKGEGSAKVGRKFDATDYVQAMTTAMQRMAAKKMTNKAGKPITALTERQIEDIRTGLNSMSHTEREAKKKAWLANPFYAKALAEIKAKNIDTSKTVEMPDLF